MCAMHPILCWGCIASGNNNGAPLCTTPQLDISKFKHFDVVVACEDEDGEDLDVPLLSIKYRS